MRRSGRAALTRGVYKASKKKQEKERNSATSRGEEDEEDGVPSDSTATCG